LRFFALVALWLRSRIDATKFAVVFFVSWMFVDPITNAIEAHLWIPACADTVKVVGVFYFWHRFHKEHLG
jgi:hypothetical protein